MASKPDLRVIDTASIRENPVALRSVNRDTEKYRGLVDSIKQVGVMNAPNVRVSIEDGVECFELIDGLHRYTAACDVGLKQIPVQVLTLDDAQAKEAQLMANFHKVETRPVEYTKMLQRIFAGNPTLTMADMATKLATSPSWIGARLNLLKLDDKIQAYVDDGKITVSNAVSLAKLPVEEQLNYVDQAMTMGSDEFVPLAQARAKELKDAARQGRSAEPAVFVPLPRVQKMSVLKEEHENGTIGPELCKKHKAKTPAAGFALGVAFAISLDPTAVEIRTAADAQKKADLADAKKKRAAERAKKKAEEATQLAAKAAEEAGVTG